MKITHFPGAIKESDSKNVLTIASTPTPSPAPGASTPSTATKITVEQAAEQAIQNYNIQSYDNWPLTARRELEQRLGFLSDKQSGAVKASIERAVILGVKEYLGDSKIYLRTLYERDAKMFYNIVQQAISAGIIAFFDEYEKVLEHATKEKKEFSSVDDEMIVTSAIEEMGVNPSYPEQPSPTPQPVQKPKPVRKRYTPEQRAKNESEKAFIQKILENDMRFFVVAVKNAVSKSIENQVASFMPESFRSEFDQQRAAIDAENKRLKAWREEQEKAKGVVAKTYNPMETAQNILAKIKQIMDQRTQFIEAYNEGYNQWKKGVKPEVAFREFRNIAEYYFRVNVDLTNIPSNIKPIPVDLDI